MNINRKYLLLIGWLMLLTIIVLSLVNINSAIPSVKHGDKYGHFIAYFCLMTWFAWLYPKIWVRNVYAIAFIFMGGALEVLQSMTAYRSMDIDDFHVNTIGVIAGVVFAAISSHMGFIKKTFRL